MKQDIVEQARARLATLAQLRTTVLPAYLDPIPCNRTLQIWFDQAGIPRLKANAAAKRGGGPCFWSVSHVEKFFRTRTLPGRLTIANTPKPMAR